MCYLAAILGSSLALASPNCADDFRLMAGLTSVIATSIEQDGFPCDRVSSIAEGRFDDEGGRVLEVVCRLAAPAGSVRRYRVVAHTEGDFVASPAEDPALASIETAP